MLIIAATFVISGILAIILWLFAPGLHGHRFAAFIPLLLSMLLSAVLLTFAIRKALKPFMRLKEHMEKVAGGDFSVRIEEDGSGELLMLQKSFNRMAEELSGIEMLRKDFIDTFSHEFKTPIVSIRGFAKRLRAGVASEEKKSEYLDFIISESERLSQLAQSILLLSQYENQLVVTDKKPYWLDEQLRRCVLALERQWEKKGLRFELELQELRYCSDEDMMEHVWRNIIANAIKFSADGGKIRIVARTSGENILVSIHDEGEGIGAEAIPHIFDKFYQGDAAHSREGNGLGLSLVRRIVDLAGGDIEVESQVGRGTAFHVRLPLTQF